MKSSLDELIKKDKKFLRKKRPGQQSAGKGPQRIKNKGAGIFKNKNKAGGRPEKKQSGSNKGAALKVRKPLKKFGKANRAAGKPGSVRSLSKGDRKARLQEKLNRRQNKKQFKLQGKGQRQQGNRVSKVPESTLPSVLTLSIRESILTLLA